MKKGILALIGSGEFTTNVLPIDKFLLSQTKNPKVAIFPTAAGQESDYQKWIDMGEKHYAKLGAMVRGFDVKDKDSANSQKIVLEIKDYNFFVFSGGDPGYLLKTIEDSLVWQVILERYKTGSILVGSSAGAMVMGRKVWGSIYKFDKENVLLPWDKGLNLVEFGILPHFDIIKNYLGKKRTKKAFSNIPTDLTVLGIDENTAYINTNGNWIKKGMGKVHIPAKI